MCAKQQHTDFSFLAFILFLLFIILIYAPSGLPSTGSGQATQPDKQFYNPAIPAIEKNEFIHVYVALCDNESQGIVPVPKKIGNGNDPANNLYWGCGYGVRTYFSKSPDWQLMNTSKPKQGSVLERCVFKQVRSGIYMVAEAYRGSHINHCINDFIFSAAGKRKDTLSFPFNKDTVRLDMNKEKMIVYVGHDGLMEFTPDSLPKNKTGKKNDVMIFACTSKIYFKEAIKTAGANPVLWTTNLMSPEAYSLKGALDGYLLNETGQQIRIRAATAYDKYLKCGLQGAKNLFATGW